LDQKFFSQVCVGHKEYFLISKKLWNFILLFLSWCLKSNNQKNECEKIVVVLINYCDEFWNHTVSVKWKDQYKKYVRFYLIIEWCKKLNNEQTSINNWLYPDTKSSLWE